MKCDHNTVNEHMSPCINMNVVVIFTCINKYNKTFIYRLKFLNLYVKSLIELQLIGSFTEKLNM